MEEVTIGVSPDELGELFALGTPCVSCCLPLPAAGQDVLELPQEFDHLLATASARLQALGHNERESGPLLAPLHALRADEQLWNGPGRAVAVFAAPDFFRSYHLPQAVPLQVHVGAHPFIRPLLPLLSAGRFLIFAANRERARLIDVDGQQAVQRDLPGYPGVLEDFERAKGEDRPGWSEAPGATGMGYSVGEPDPAEDKYFAALATAVNHALAGENRPLVLAGDDELIGELRKHLKYAHLVPDFIHGNPDHENAAQLRDKAWPLASSSVTHARQAAWDQLARCATEGQGLADDLSEVLEAANGGQVAALFLPGTGDRWGRYDAAQNTLEETAADAPGAEELLNLAAVLTLSRGGQVYVADQPLPAGMRFAATLRY